METKNLKISTTAHMDLSLDSDEVDMLIYLANRWEFINNVPDYVGRVLTETLSSTYKAIYISDQATGLTKEKSKDTYKKDHNHRHPNRSKARNKVTSAISSGKILPAKDMICFRCREPAHSYHHYNGYNEENALNVMPLCLSCHKLIDKVKT